MEKDFRKPCYLTTNHILITNVKCLDYHIFLYMLIKVKRDGLIIYSYYGEIMDCIGVKFTTEEYKTFDMAQSECESIIRNWYL